VTARAIAVAPNCYGCEVLRSFGAHAHQRAERHNGGPVTTPDDADKHEFMRIVRQEARPFAAAGWRVGGSGLRRQAESGHWAHVWFYSSRFNRPLALQPVAGTVAPYLLRVFNRQRIDRPPHVNFIAVHSSLRPLERWIEFVPTAEVDTAPLDQTPEQRTLTSVNLPSWLSTRFAALLPRLAALSSDRALLAWLSDEARSPTSAELRYASLLAWHLRLDDEMQTTLARAEQAAGVEDAAAAERGVDRSYRSDRQSTYPQDWSHARFVTFLRGCPRDAPP
jgi:hypothetical protein